MMAFYSVLDNQNRKTFRPTPDFEKVLDQEIVTEKDLQVFRTSNKVEHLIRSVLEKRGFVRLDHRREWRKQQGKSGLSSLGKAMTEAAKSLKLPQKSTVAIQDLIASAFDKYIMQFGQPANTLFLSNEDLLKLRYSAIASAGTEGLAFGSTYIGMVIREGAKGSKPICANLAQNAAEIASKSKSFEMIQNEYGETVGKMFYGDPGVEIVDRPVIKVEADVQKHVPPMKKVIPPSRMARKLL